VVQDQFKTFGAEDIARKLFSANVFTGYPYLLESRVISLSDDLFVYTSQKKKGKFEVEKKPHDSNTLSVFNASCQQAERYYSKRCGIEVGNIEMTARIEVVVGMQFLIDGSIVKRYQQVSDFEIPVQLIVFGSYHDPRYKNIPSPAVSKEYPIDSFVVFLAPLLYGVVGKVQAHLSDDKLAIQVEVTIILT
jgi:5'-3' exoribonuclease 1